MKIILPNTSLVAVILLILFFSRCSDESTNGVVELEECDSDLIVSVSDGTTPTFTWEPECGVALFSVQDKDSSRIEDMWRFFTGSNIIPSGVKYGILPDSAYVVDGPTTLVSGTQYEVLVFWVKVANLDEEDNFGGPFTQLFIP